MGHHSIKVSASILSANFLTLGADIESVDQGGVDSLHLDIMDNHMAPSISFGPPIIKPIPSITTLPLDAHLMIDAPWLFFDAYIDCGVTDICFHIEAYDKTQITHKHILSESRKAHDIDLTQLKTDIHYLQSKGIKACITINPNTDPIILFPILNEVDGVLVMSAHPGFSGQSFIETSLQKVADIRSRFSGDIKVDGGVNKDNAKALVDSGATTLISASYLFNAPDVKQAIDSLKPTAQ